MGAIRRKLLRDVTDAFRKLLPVIGIQLLEARIDIFIGGRHRLSDIFQSSLAEPELT